MDRCLYVAEGIVGVMIGKAVCRGEAIQFETFASKIICWPFEGVWLAIPDCVDHLHEI
ncbi:hypothetical protein OAV60_03935 [Paracoccaceae bacterium]|nr:hypothetical protein [Paracoccaceae bacterium]